MRLKTKPGSGCSSARKDPDLCFSTLGQQSGIDSSVRIDTFGNSAAEVESLAHNSIITNPFIPQDASSRERNIHDFLNKLFVYQVNAKEMLEEE